MFQAVYCPCQRSRRRPRIGMAARGGRDSKARMKVPYACSLVLPTSASRSAEPHRLYVSARAPRTRSEGADSARAAAPRIRTSGAPCVAADLTTTSPRGPSLPSGQRALRAIRPIRHTKGTRFFHRARRPARSRTTFPLECDLRMPMHGDAAPCAHVFATPVHPAPRPHATGGARAAQAS